MKRVKKPVFFIVALLILALTFTSIAGVYGQNGDNKITYIKGAGDKKKEGGVTGRSIVVYPMFGEPYEVPLESGEGGHGGGDPVLLNDIFGIPEPDPLNRAASHVDGAMSILTGIAANKSLATGMPVNIKDLVQF